MSELRWILLVFGALFCIGLWWWETRRQRQAASTSVSARPQERFEPALSSAENPRTPAYEPPLIEHEDVFGDEQSMVHTRTIPDVKAALSAESAHADTEFERIEPTISDVPEPASQPAPPQTPPPPEQLIVSLRLAAPPLERFEGRALVQAMRTAGLEHGQFAIFHKCTPAGEIVFSVASLVEPGSFDLERVDGRRFPGVTLFMVLPNPLDGSAALEDMIGTARQLADQLNGSLQDGRGLPLSSKRLVDMRGDVTTWQLRARAAGAAAPASQPHG